MARLIFKTNELGMKAVELRLGINRIGRARECEIILPHDSVSLIHAEISLSNDGVYLRDCGSTNGTFLNGQPCREAWLEAGQAVRFGQIEVTVDSVAANVAIPQFDRTTPPPPAPVILANGVISCSQHPESPATFRCTYCQEHMCNLCVKLLRLEGRAPHFLCRVCSHQAERLDTHEKNHGKGFLSKLQAVVKTKWFKGPGDQTDG